MRWIILLILAGPAAAWEFTLGLPCVLTHAEPGLEVELTHDPTQPLYSITLRRDTPWPDAPVFSIAFANGPTISTPLHALSESGRAVSVADRGFGNVIAGLIAGGAAQARLGDVTATFSLDGAAGPTQDYATCQPPLGA
ncbi:MAG: hypothetical protein MK180_16130 [Rhodobacteraceae bacterium]|nr:hypothetical protein [Paracoccaceae bacterium]